MREFWLLLVGPVQFLFILGLRVYRSRIQGLHFRVPGSGLGTPGTVGIDGVTGGLCGSLFRIYGGAFRETAIYVIRLDVRIHRRYRMITVR